MNAVRETTAKSACLVSFVVDKIEAETFNWLHLQKYCEDVFFIL